MDSKELVKTPPAPPMKEPEKPLEIQEVEAKLISRMGETSDLQLTEKEKEILFAPIDPADVQVKPPNTLFLNWTWYANRLDAAFGAGEWQVTPSPLNPRIAVQGKTVYGQYVLWIRKRLASFGVGAHTEERATFNLGDAMKSADSDGLTQCCKKLGMGRDLWSPRIVEEIKQRRKVGSFTSPSKKETSGLATNAPAQPTTLPEGLEKQLAILEKIRAFLIELYPGLGPAEKTAKADACKRWFHATWGEMQKFHADILEARFAEMVKYYAGENK